MNKTNSKQRFQNFLKRHIQNFEGCLIIGILRFLHLEKYFTYKLSGQYSMLIQIFLNYQIWITYIQCSSDQ
ncbi:unnamed protein product [Paramecium octaurelia]|uniref:Uncharacterized protein n=1 Tax=Paramecium octaurelia TaxID=43137 RepID=A0A8S1W969_PAROT|nr:unnamed protein product [Paramecium octaurelia]